MPLRYLVCYLVLPLTLQGEEAQRVQEELAEALAEAQSVALPASVSVVPSGGEAALQEIPGRALRWRMPFL